MWLRVQPLVWLAGGTAFDVLEDTALGVAGGTALGVAEGTVFGLAGGRVQPKMWVGVQPQNIHRIGISTTKCDTKNPSVVYGYTQKPHIYVQQQM